MATPARSVTERLIDSTLTAIARQGVSGVTLDEIARDAECSRATLYRHFAGKQELLRVALESEVARAVSGLDAVLSEARDLEESIVSGMLFGFRLLERHEPLRMLVAEDPDLALPYLSFTGADETIRVTAQSVAKHVGAFGLSYDEGYRLGEWATRLVLSYSMTPSRWLDTHDDEQVRRFVRTFVLPAFSTGASSEQVPEAALWRK